MIKLKSVEQFEKELNKFIEAKHKSIDEHTKALEQAKADKAAGEAAADAALKAEDINAYRKAMDSCRDAEFYIKLHTQKLEQLNSVDIEQPKAEDVKRFLVEDITKHDDVEARQMYEYADNILALGKAANDNVIKCRNLFRSYCSEVLCLKEDSDFKTQVAVNSIISRSVDIALNAVQSIPGFREHRGMKPNDKFIDSKRG